MSQPVSRPKQKKLSAEDRAAIRRDHARGGKSIGQIATDRNLSRATVGNIINFRGAYRE